MFPPIRKLEPVAREIIGLLNKQPSRFVFEDLLGVNNGITMMVREILPNGEERKFILKAAANCTDDSIQKESAWIQRLQYAAHVSNPITLSDSPLASLEGPYFLTEYLAHGTLFQFQERTIKANQHIPNRMMWSIFLCLVRGCIAMAYHPPGPDIQLEQVRDEEPSSLAHNDMHGNNFVFGMLEKTKFISKGGIVYLEHSLLPPLKLIDFGLATEAGVSVPTDLHRKSLFQHDISLGLTDYREPIGRRNQGIDDNILDIGVVMARIVRARPIGLLHEARQWIRNPAIRSDLDPNLRLMIQFCLAVDPVTRPRLEELNVMINGGFFNKTADNYGEAGKGDGLESDETFRRIVSTYILNADT
ncbi:hypothetical protein F4805DRAFT_459326 [Annulohypoxylon moriforme]|nr:hypothetical protein F4805DRAFT_459326 [Annulohypoxylon moriforme]